MVLAPHSRHTSHRCVLPALMGGPQLALKPAPQLLLSAKCSNMSDSAAAALSKAGISRKKVTHTAMYSDLSRFSFRFRRRQAGI